MRVTERFSDEEIMEFLSLSQEIFDEYLKQIIEVKEGEDRVDEGLSK